VTSRLLLHSALATNAGFSAASGLVLLIAPESIGGVIGVDVDWFMRSFGAALLAHAALLVLVVGRPDVSRWAKLNLAAIAPYPVAMVAIAAIIAEGSSGRALVLADGAAIALIAIALTVGLRHSDCAPE
jgi:hypothetical protein